MYLNTVFKYNVFKYCPALNTTKISIVSEIKGPITKFHFRNVDQ